VLIGMRDLEAIARGEIGLAFRRWKRPTVKTGGTLRTAVGVLAIESVEPVEETEISEEDARRAGFELRETLVARLRKQRQGRIYRIELRLSGPDPREELRNRVDLTEGEIADLEKRLARFDKASPQGPWTGKILQLIAERPATRAADLAATAGFETRWFKTRVRKLKELGLTQSLETGYRLSPRGEAYVARKRRGS
jgi:hypothetical protein